jgi:hypothetical protein
MWSIISFTLDGFDMPTIFIFGGLILPLGTNFHIVGVAALFARIWGKFEINLVLK